AHAHLDHHPRPMAVHQAADKGTEARRDDEPKRECPGRRAPLPAKLVEDRWKQQRKGRARIDTQAHGDAGDGHDDPAVEDGETLGSEHTQPSSGRPRQHSRAILAAAHGTPYATEVGTRCTGGSPRLTRWMFSAMPCARASSIPSVQPDTWGVMSTLGKSWNA